jgi:hypothetical protein
MKPAYGVAVLLIAVLVIGSSGVVYYYNDYQQASASRATYVSELTSETSQYSSLAANYDSAIALDNSTIALLAGTIAVINTSMPIYQQASSQLSQLWARYLALKPVTSSLYAADVMFDYGNGTRVWHNATQVQPGWNMYTETVLLTGGDMQATWYPSFGEHFITSIGGVADTPTSSWFLWTYNRTASWQVAAVGADDLPVYDGSVFAWTFCAETASSTPECSP